MIEGSLADIKHGTYPNNPGISSVLAIQLAALAYPTDMMQILLNEQSGGFTDQAVYQQLSTNPGCNWINLANDFPYPFEFKEQANDTENNSFFTYTLTQMVPHDDYVTLGQVLRGMDRNEWVLVVKQNNGQTRLLGYSNGRGCKFKDKYDSGKPMKSPSAHALTYTWESSERAIYLADPSTGPQIILNSVTNDAGGYVWMYLSSLNITGSVTVTLDYVGFNQANNTNGTLNYFGASPFYHPDPDLASGKYWVQASVTIAGITYYSAWVLYTQP